MTMWKYAQRIGVGAGAAACVGAVILSLVRPDGPGKKLTAAAALLVLGLAGILYAALRGWRFQKRLRRFVRLLLAGKYNLVIPVSKPRDEITELEEMLNKLADQLNTYDRLRADRMFYNQRLLDAILEHVSEPVILLDVERELLECNPAAQAALKTTQHKLNLGTLAKSEGSKSFLALLSDVVEKDRIPREESVSIQVSASESPRRFTLSVYPVKDRGGKVIRALVLFQPTEGRGDTSADPSRTGSR